MSAGNEGGEAAADGIAIVGMAVRFPGADTVEAFWRNLRAGVESIRFFRDEELRAAGVGAELLANPAYVRANGTLAGAGDFDAAFFGMTPREAETTDPQHRVFLEVAWEALERAGYNPAGAAGKVGVFAGAGLSTYLLKHLAPNRAFVESVDELALLLGNNKDFVPTRTSYKLNLRGPSVAVNTACSTSLVAVHLACQSLLDYHCDMALAGGVSIQVPQDQGYLHQEGGIGSPDGHCRAFDAAARGTVSGNGAGVVVLKRLAEALTDGDIIHAVIRGSAVNNDGANKIGFTAPSVDGQSQVIAEALAVAGVAPEEISYVEAHGTGTELGDPIEVAALTQVFGASARPGTCALGSVKTNFGHLDEAAGVAGLVKTVLALQHRELPPSLHYTQPNPKIDFSSSPFVVNARLKAWESPPDVPRRAGVSSFGIGGTNAHVVIEEAPPRAPAAPDGAWHVLVVSARTPTALTRAAENLADWLEANAAVPLGDIAWTLAVGRSVFDHRRFVVVREGREAAALLRAGGTAGAGAPEKMVALGRTWAEGGVIDWIAHFAGPPRRRLVLPTYPFERQRFWIDPPSEKEPEFRGSAPPKRENVQEWFYHSTWQRSTWSPLRTTSAVPPRSFLWFGREEVTGAVARLRAAGHKVSVHSAAADFTAVFAAEAEAAEIVFAGAFGASGSFAAVQQAGYHRLLALVQALARTEAATRRRVTVVADGLADVIGDEPLDTAKGTLLGLARAIPQEYPGLACRVLDVPLSGDAAEFVAAELAGDGSESFVACRSERRWVHQFAPLRLDPSAGAARLRERGVYLITGGLGGVGLIVAEYLARACRARLVLAGRTGLPPRAEWDQSATETRVDFDLAAETASLEAAEARLTARADLAPAGTFEVFARELDALCANYVFHYVAGARPGVASGERDSRTELRARLGVLPGFAKFFDCMLQMMAAEGHVRTDGETVEWRRAPGQVPSAASLRVELERRFPEFHGILALVDHCVRHYPEALSGRIPAIGVLYPEGRSELLETSARQTVRHSNKEVYLALVQELAERLAPGTNGRPLRILEVGVGDGLLAGRMAPALAGKNVEYHATDLSRAFVVKAEHAATKAGFGFMRFGTLDISRDPVAQGHAAGGYDLILGLDVVHATPRLAETTGHLRRLLAPGGLLALVEKVRPDRWVDLVWGLAEGWWYFADLELRPHSPLLAAEGWERVLRAGNFSAVTAFPREASARQTSEYALVVAQAPGVPSAATAVDARTRERILAVRQLEALGAEVAIEVLDVADGASVRGAVARTQERWGGLHGVVHAAGLTAGGEVFNLLRDATSEQADALFRPKAGGAEALAVALEGRAVDFFLLISSNASVLGGLGLGAYAAANAFLDLFATAQRRRGLSGWVSSNWDGWPTEERFATNLRVTTGIDRYAMTRAEAETAFAAVIGAPTAQVVVSSADLEARVAHWARRSNPIASTTREESVRTSNAVAVRSESAASFVAPRTETERVLAAIWEELLGVEPVGVEDDFFALNGDSLLGMQLMAHAAKSFGVTLGVGVLFEAPTVKALAAKIDAARRPVSAGTEEEEGEL